MKKYLEQVKRKVDDLQASIFQIPRGENEQANRLAKAVSAEHMVIPNKVLFFTQCSPLIGPIDMQEVGFENNWTTPLVSYLKNGALLDGRGATRKLKVQTARFIFIKGCLVQKRILLPVPKVLKPRRGKLCHDRSP